MKKFRFLALLCAAALIVALFAGCGSSSAFETKPEETKTSETAKPAETEAEPEYEVTLNVAHVQSDGDNVAQAYALALKEACKKYGIKIEIFPGAQLGDSAALVEGVQMGTIDINITGTADYGKLYAPLGVLDLAYIWKDYDQMAGVLNGEVGTELAKGLLDAAGVRILAYSVSFGYRCVGTVGEKNAFTNLDEAKALNLKIRTIESDVYINTMQAMGLNPTPMGFGEVYTSLQTHVIDGYEHDCNTSLANAFDEVIDHYMLTKHMCGPMGLFMSEISFQKLTEEQQKNLLAAAEEASAAHTAMAPEKEAVSLAEMESSGVDIVEVDVDSFAKAVNEFNIKYCEEKGWTDVYNKIVG